MDGREFFEKIVKPNYYEAKRNPEDFRLIWNAIVSMNTVPEFVALERLNYITGREAADKESAAIRNEHQSLLDLKECAEALKHVRKQKHSDSGITTDFRVSTTSTSIYPSQPLTWLVDQYDLTNVLDEAFKTLLCFPELSQLSNW